jgi:hypothetical protein
LYMDPRLHVCFDKVNNGLMFKIISSTIIMFTISKWPHTPQTKLEVGYVLKLGTKNKLH